jgi:hypothetical protein
VLDLCPLHCKHIYIYVYMYVYITMFSPTVASRGEEKKGRKRGSVPWAGAEVQLPLQVFQGKSDLVRVSQATFGS